MKAYLIALFLLAAGAAVTAGCSSDPCSDLKSYADSCADPQVKALGISVAAANDKDQCRLYRDAWYYTYEPRCNAWGDGGSVDSGVDAAAAAQDSGLQTQDVPDAGAIDAGDLDAAEIADAGGDI